MTNRKSRLRLLGLWKGVFPAPQLLLRERIPPGEREDLAAYIDAACDAGGFLFDCWADPVCHLGECAAGHSEGYPDGLKSDGVWIFPASLSHYVRRGVDLPEDFCRHARQRGFIPERVRVTKHTHSDDFGDYWSSWCFRQAGFRKDTIGYTCRYILWFIPDLAFRTVRYWLRERLLP